jgi:hypothetical protein
MGGKEFVRLNAGWYIDMQTLFLKMQKFEYKHRKWYIDMHERAGLCTFCTKHVQYN